MTNNQPYPAEIDTQLTLFDYQQLDSETRIVVQQRTSEIKTLMKRTSQDIIEIGEKLIEVKGRLPHGAFGGWLESEFQWSDRTAQKYMAIAGAFSNTKSSSDLAMSFETMAFLAAPSTPEPARIEAIDRAEAGERVTHKAAKEIVQEHKAPPPPPATTPQTAPPTVTPQNGSDTRYSVFECPACGEKKIKRDRGSYSCHGCQAYWDGGKAFFDHVNKRDVDGQTTACQDCGARLMPNDIRLGITLCKACAQPDDDRLPDWVANPEPIEPLASDEPGQSYNYKRDAKTAVPQNVYVPHGSDACQTPAYALDPLLPYLPADWVIWEPAQGEGLMVEGLCDAGRTVIGSDLITGENFLEWEPDEEWGCIVTNPPFSIKFPWIERCYQLGKPFALLLPVETLGTAAAQAMFEQHGMQLILLNKRINFKMPNLGWEGGGAPFPTAWYTWGLDLPADIVYGKLTDR